MATSLDLRDTRRAFLPRIGAYRTLGVASAHAWGALKGGWARRKVGVVYRLVEPHNLPRGREGGGSGGVHRAGPRGPAGLPDRRHGVPRAGRLRTAPAELPR